MALIKRENILILGVSLVAAAGLTLGWLKFGQPLPQPEALTLVEQKTVLIIDDGQSGLKTFETVLSGEKKMTAFGLLEAGAEELGLPLKSTNYEFGVFLEAIGEVKNGQDGKYWMYYVNGVLPQVAADKTELSPGDKVEFKFETSTF